MNENVAQIFAKSNRQLPGVTAQDCDRALVISGGVDASNNHKRYENNVKASFSKLKSLGFSDEQISVFYNNGSAINVDEGGSNTNVTDFPTTKEGLIAYFKGLALIMQGSCTLTILVTDHGTGFDPTRNYKGARPALLGTEAATGTSFSESDVKFDGRSKTYRTSTNFRYRGKIWFFAKDENGDIELYQRDGDKWVLKGENGNGDNIISETELGGFDINGDGDTTDTNFGISVAWLEAKPANTRKHQDNAWDSDGDGTDDVRLRWDGTRYVSERLDQGTWKEMGRDTDGDFIIDSTDGGSDWDLDGDKGGKVGFHEGINLWGSEVLWDDELAEMLKPLSKMGIHIMMAMNSCYSGGFLKNLEGIVENIYAGSSEDNVNYSRYNSDRTQIYAADFLEFLDKLDGIDTDSWNAATDAAIAEDDLVATGNEATKNIHSHGQTQRHETSSIYQVESETGEYTIQLDLPDDLVGQIYDFEFILGLQNPRWSNVSFPSGLPSGLETELAPGGVRVFSSDPIEDNITLKIKVSGATVDDNIRIEYTDVDHKRLGYTVASAGTIVSTPNNVAVISMPTVCVNHTDHGQSSPSIVEFLFGFLLWSGADPADFSVSIQFITPSGFENSTVPLTSLGQLYYLFLIQSFGNYSYSIDAVTYIPTGETIEFSGDSVGSFTVDSSETNKGQCTASN